MRDTERDKTRIDQPGYRRGNFDASYCSVCGLHIADICDCGAPPLDAPAPAFRVSVDAVPHSGYVAIAYMDSLIHIDGLQFEICE